MTVSSETVGELGSDGMAKTKSQPINVVRLDRPKLLVNGLNQKGEQSGYRAVFSRYTDKELSADRLGLNHHNRI